MACCTASDFSLISYSSPRLPSPENSLGNCLNISVGDRAAVMIISSSLLARLRAVMAGSTRRLLFSPLMMSIFCFCLELLPLKENWL